MKAFIISKALVRAAYQRKLLDLEHLGCEVQAGVPVSWIEEGHKHDLETLPEAHHMIRPLSVRLNGRFHLHHYPGLSEEIDLFGPDLVFIDEEPYNVATLQAVRDATSRKLPAVFFTWQNLDRGLPLPFRLIQRYVFDRCRVAIAGTSTAEEVLRARGFRGRVVVTPQFGVDTEVFSPGNQLADRPFTVGYIGRLVPQKGVHMLIDAVAGADDRSWRLMIAGFGPMRETLQRAAAEAGLGERCQFESSVPSTDVPAWLRQLDAAVLPSISAPRWKEQFGRMAVEAMSCGVPVVGSDSGEIPSVIGNAGLIFPENDVEALRRCLGRLAREPELRRELGERGRQRVIEGFSSDRIAQETFHAFELALQAG